MKAKKIAIFYAGAKHWGGIETYLEQIFLNVDKKKLDLYLVSLGDWELGQKIPASRVILIDNKWYNPMTVKTLANILKAQNFDLVTSQGLVANFYGRMGSHFSGVPNLITIHSDYKFDYEGIKEMLFWASFRLFAPMTKQYVVVSNFLKKETVKLGVPEKKIKLVYNGVKEISPQPKKRGKEVIFGSLGRLHFKKGYHVLIEAVSLIREMNFKVYIWGAGEEKEHLEMQISERNLQDKVILMGFTRDIPKALAETDIYIQPSLEEGFGITVVEAMYAEKPIIIAPSGSLPELISDGVTGIVANDASPVSIASAMKYALEHESKTMGKKARKEALGRFGIDKWIEQIEEVYLGAAK
jgi:glycosyltransferase involved in cell wall biosynthesis